MPRVSVIIPTYQRSQALRATVESVLSQSYGDWELILVDDGSRDDTPEVCRELAQRDARVRFVAQANGGGAAARGHGLSLARGEYVAYLDHDDLWLPHKVERQVELLDRSPELGWCYGRFELFQPGGEVLGDFHELYDQTPWAGWIQDKLLLHQNFIGTYSIPLIRRELLLKVGPPRAEAGLSDDWDLFIRLAGVSPVGFIDEVLMRYDSGNPESQSRGDMERAYRCEASVVRMNRDAINRLPLAQRWSLERNVRRRWGKWLKDKALWAQRDGELTVARRTYLQAARIDPLLFANLTTLKDVMALWRTGTARR